MKIDSNNSVFSSKDFSFEAFQKHKKESASSNEQSNALPHSQEKSQVNASSQNDQSESRSDSNTSSKDKNAFAATKDSYTFSAASYFQSRKDAESNEVEEVAKNLIETQIQQAEENGSSNSGGITAGSVVSSGAIKMSDTMEARNAGAQAENLQASRQNAVLAAGIANIAASSGTSSAIYLEGLRTESRMMLEKRQSVQEKAEETFEDIDRNRDEQIEEMNEEKMNGESTEETTSETVTEETTTENTSEDISENTTESTNGDSNADPVITTGSGNGEAVITTGSGNGDPVITTGSGSGGSITTGGGSYEASITTGSSSSEPVITTSIAGNTSSTTSFKGIDIRV